jgi:hypothetical protein
LKIDIQESEDGRQIKCTICPAHRHWIRRGGLSEHINSQQHQDCVRIAKEAIQHQVALEKAREMDKMATDLRSTFGVPLGTVELESGGSSGMKSAAEVEMWADYEMNGAQFDVDEDKATTDRAQYDRQEKVFGLWNAVSMAREFGYDGSGNTQSLPVLGDEEDQLLAEILESVRESHRQTFRQIWELVP